MPIHAVKTAWKFETAKKNQCFRWDCLWEAMHIAKLASVSVDPTWCSSKIICKRSSSMHNSSYWWVNNMLTKRSSTKKNIWFRFEHCVSHDRVLFDQMWSPAWYSVLNYFETSVIMVQRWSKINHNWIPGDHIWLKNDFCHARQCSKLNYFSYTECSHHFVFESSLQTYMYK